MAEDRRRRRRGARKNLIYFRDWMLILTPSRCGRDVAYRRPRRGLQSAASPVLVTDAPRCASPPGTPPPKMHSRDPVRRVMPTEARTARVVYGLMGNRFGRVAPKPLLPEEFC